MTIKILMLVIFFGVMLAIGFYCRKHATDVNGFVLGGRSVGPWLTAFAYGTSYFSAVIFVGYAGQFGWKYGIASTWIGIGNALLGSMLAWVVLGRRTRVMTQHLDSATMPEFFGTRFQSKNLKIVASVIVFVFLIPYTASLYNGLSRLFGMAFHIDYAVCILVMAVLTGIYVVAGGYMATAINDFLQGLIMLFGIVVVIAAVLKSNGGFLEALNGLANVEDAAASTQPGVFASFFGPDPFNLLCVVVLTSLGTWGLPQMVQKFYAIKSEKDVHIGTIVSTVFAIVVAGGSYFLGGFGRLFADKIEYTAAGTPVYDSIMTSMMALLPDILVAVVIMLVLSASMSTLSSLVLTSSSVITIDLVDELRSKKMSEKRRLLTMRVFLVFFVAVSAIIALIQYKSASTFIAQLMGISWGALAGAFLGPFLYSLYWKKVTKAAVWCSFIVGIGFTTGNMIAGMAGHPLIASPINAGALAMLLSLVLVPIISLITKKPDSEYTEKIFSCYDEKVLTSRKNALEDGASQENI